MGPLDYDTPSEYLGTASNRSAMKYVSHNVLQRNTIPPPIPNIISFQRHRLGQINGPDEHRILGRFRELVAIADN
jgi:hypothetical protein